MLLIRLISYTYVHGCYVHISIHNLSMIQDGNQPVHIAARNGRVEIIEYLVKEHDPALIDAAVQVCILLCI